MSLIIYPQDGWNTFADLPTLSATIQARYPLEWVAFDALTVDEQTALAMNATMLIQTCSGIKYPDPIHQDFILAQSIIMVTSVGKSILDYDANGRAITKEKVGTLEVDYDPRYKANELDINPLIYRILSPYGCSGNTGFSQSGTVKA